MAKIELSFAPNAAHVRTARQVAVALARRAQVPDDALDEIRLAVGEACGLAVSLQRLARPDEPVTLVFDDRGGLAVDVCASVPLATATGEHALDVLADAIGVEGQELPTGAVMALLAAFAGTFDVTTSADGVVLALGWPPVAVT
ncbi:MAG: ATP-binding protein [Jiangellaceae bacterium]